MPYSITRENAGADSRALRSILASLAAVGCSTSAAVQLTELADSIEEQIPQPAVEEPSVFGSIVRATCAHGKAPQLWQRSYDVGKHYWESEHGVIDLWSDLSDVEVLRVGVGGDVSFVEGFDAACKEFVRDLTKLRDELITAPEKSAIDKAIASAKHQQEWQ